jgi:NAD(P)H-hydrate epimerase
LYVPEDIYPVVASAAAPEVMVQPVDSYLRALEGRHDVLALGPGIGHGRRSEVLEIIRRAKQPMVIDADGLNILSQELIALELAAGPRLLTPHPGEMARLAPDLAEKPRQEIVSEWIARQQHVLLLKGSRTIIGEHGRPLVYNSTGNPGMATGGMGDVLTGVLGALIGGGLDLYDAAQAGAWLCGRAAELAIASGLHSLESLTATAVISNLGGAFESLRSRSY